MPVTLEEIKAEQAKVAELIAKFEAQAQSRTLTIAGATISLANGEEYAGVILGKEGAPSHHLILLPGDPEGITWAEAKSWAAEVGGELPTRREQALLFANLKEQFEEAWYWSGEQHASHSDSAWSQHFDDGHQTSSNKSLKLRARAVRRLEIQ